MPIPAVELSEWPEAPGAQTYRGPDGAAPGVREVVRDAGSGCTSRSRSIVEAGDRVLVTPRISAPREAAAAIEVEIRSFNVYTFRDGKVTRIQLFTGARARARGRRTDAQLPGGEAMSRFEDPVIITCSISGAVANREQCPAIPYTPEEYAAEARRIVDEGGVDDPHPRAHARRRAELRGRGLPQHHRRDPDRGRRRDHQLLDRRGRRPDREAASSTCARCGPRWAR